MILKQYQINVPLILQLFPRWSFFCCLSQAASQSIEEVFLSFFILSMLVPARLADLASDALQLCLLKLSLAGLIHSLTILLPSCSQSHSRKRIEQRSIFTFHLHSIRLQIVLFNRHVRTLLLNKIHKTQSPFLNLAYQYEQFFIFHHNLFWMWQ